MRTVLSCDTVAMEEIEAVDEVEEDEEVEEDVVVAVAVVVVMLCTLNVKAAYALTAFPN